MWRGALGAGGRRIPAALAHLGSRGGALGSAPAAAQSLASSAGTESARRGGPRTHVKAPHSPGRPCQSRAARGNARVCAEGHVSQNAGCRPAPAREGATWVSRDSTRLASERGPRPLSQRAGLHVPFQERMEAGPRGDGGNAVSGLRGAGLLPPGSGLRGAARRGRRAPWRTWSVKRCPVKRKETVRNTADAGSPPPQRGLPLQKPGLSREPLAAGVLQGGNYCTDGSVLESQAGNLPQATTGGGRSRSVGCLQRGGRRSSGRRVTVLHR